MLESLAVFLSRLGTVWRARLRPDGDGACFERLPDDEMEPSRHEFADVFSRDDLVVLDDPLAADVGRMSHDAATSPTIPPVFDAAKLDELKAVMDQTKFTGLVGQFAESLQARIDRLQGLLKKSNWPDAAREAHDIVSVAGNVGAARLSALARDIEKSCKASNDSGCRSLSAAFTNEAADALRALKAYQSAA